MPETYPVGEMPHKLRNEVMDILQAYERQRIVAACKQIRQAAKAGRERKFISDGEGGGEVKMMIHPTSYHYWGQRLGYDCWTDKQFCDEYLRDNDAARVTSRGARAAVGFRARQAGKPILQVSAGAVRERKKYKNF